MHGEWRGVGMRRRALVIQRDAEGSRNMRGAMPEAVRNELTQ